MRANALRGAIACALIVLMSSLAPVPLCHAQGRPQERARARELYAQGQRFFKEGSFESALAAFEEAHRVLPNPVVLLSIAECQVRTERFDAAVGTLQQYLSLRPNAPDMPQVQQQISAIQQKPARIDILSTPDGAELTVDGVHDTQRTPAALELLAGQHTITASAPGYISSEKIITVNIGGRESLNFALDPLPSAPVEPAPPVAVAPASERHRKADALVWTATGVSAASFLTGGILGGLALSTKSDYDKRATEALADKGERQALFADVFFGVGAAAAITGVVLYFTSDAPPAEPTLSIAPALGPQRASVVGSLRF
jgi:tetratricopeptide (TPR) repeat protein